MKWITSTTIKQWADTRSAQGLLPELILRLIRATSTNTSNIRFPNGDAVHLTGWDGVVESADAIFNISPGISLWLRYSGRQEWWPHRQFRSQAYSKDFRP